MYTRKLFEATAKVLHETALHWDPMTGDNGRANASDATRAVAKGLADIFQADNPRFNRASFLAACKVKS